MVERSDLPSICGALIIKHDQPLDNAVNLHFEVICAKIELAYVSRNVQERAVAAKIY